RLCLSQRVMSAQDGCPTPGFVKGKSCRRCDNFSTRLAQWPSGPVAQSLSGSVFELADHDAGVVPAEAERVRDADGDVGLPRLVRDVVEIALGVLLLVVDRRGQQAAFDGEHGEDG